MKKSVIFVGIKVVHAILDPSREEGSLTVRRHDALALVVGQVTRTFEAGLVEGRPAVQTQAEGAGNGLLPLLTDRRQLPPKVLVTRGLLLASPALFALAVPAVARVVRATVGKSTFLKTWLRGLLAAPSPRLPPSGKGL